MPAPRLAFRVPDSRIIFAGFQIGRQESPTVLPCHAASPGKVIEAFRPATIGKDHFPRRLVAAGPVGHFPVSVFVFPWGAVVVIRFDPGGKGAAVKIEPSPGVI